LIAILLIMLQGKQPQGDVYEEEEYIEKIGAIPHIDDEEESESTARRKQFEKMAQQKPEQLAKLLRSWTEEEKIWRCCHGKTKKRAYRETKSSSPSYLFRTRCLSTSL